MRKLLCILLSALLCLGLASVNTSAQADTRPNVMLISVDDMRADQLAYMPMTRQLLGQLNLTDFVSNHPVCCPARAEILTGQFAQNNGVFHNLGPFGAYQALNDKDNTVATWFHDAGYQTGFVGKFLNGFKPPNFPEPAGWTEFSAWVGEVYSPTDYTNYNNGDPFKPGTYTNDEVTKVATDQINKFSGNSPFFIWASYVAPHSMSNADGKWFKYGPQPAPRHAGDYSGVTPPYQKHPSYTERNGSDKDLFYTRTWQHMVESLESVDEGVRDVVNSLKANGEWDNTVVAFTSDNGLLLGEHGEHGKDSPYEESLRVPLLATGPGVATGNYSKGAAMMDIAPSFATLAGVTPGRTEDGRSDLFSATGGWDNMLIQAGNSDNLNKHFKWRGTRTARWVYTRYIGGRQTLFNLDNDPYELNNLDGQRPVVEQRLSDATPTVY